ncbi:D-alanine--D-alanine ligase [Bavariicoccus seileri]|uniref:D-alanine--D-alanine ligase n=1 Tax=Bavariicoccus seileri TaxID=549685 RepID=UPI0003B6F125|nr:D-alanine--D-alanine ligase [Bavariicoccus seileri]
MNIFLIYGGKSAEHDISVLTAFSIQKEIHYQEHTVIPIYITQQGKWLKGATINEALVEGTSLDLKEADKAIFGSESTGIAVMPTVLLSLPDAIVFPVLHGPNGEDGTIQGLFEIFDLPYVGCGVLASAAGMDKIVSKSLFQQMGLPQLPYVPITEYEWHTYPESVYAKCEGTLIYPVFVKPANMGSSVGVSKAGNREELIAAVNEAFSYDHRVVIEQGVEAREVECGVLGLHDIHTSVVGELVKSKGFYDYDEKYINNTVELQIPADLPEEISAKIQSYAKEAFGVIDGSGLSRCDFFVTEHNEIYINEINTLPGFTQFSMYPSLWKETGLQYSDLIAELLELGVRRFNEKESKKVSRNDD